MYRSQYSLNNYRFKLINQDANQPLQTDNSQTDVTKEYVDNAINTLRNSTTNALNQAITRVYTDFTADYNRIESSTNDIKNKIVQIDDSISAIGSEISDVNMRIDQSDALITNVFNQITNDVTNQYNELNDAVKHIDDQINQIDGSIKSLNSDVSAINTRINQSEVLINRAFERIDAQSSELTIANNELNYLKDKVDGNEIYPIDIPFNGFRIVGKVALGVNHFIYNTKNILMSLVYAPVLPRKSTVLIDVNESIPPLVRKNVSMNMLYSVEGTGISGNVSSCDVLTARDVIPNSSINNILSLGLSTWQAPQSYRSFNSFYHCKPMGQFTFAPYGLIVPDLFSKQYSTSYQQSNWNVMITALNTEVQQNKYTADFGLYAKRMDTDKLNQPQEFFFTSMIPPSGIFILTKDQIKAWCDYFFLGRSSALITNSDIYFPLNLTLFSKMFYLALIFQAGITDVAQIVDSRSNQVHTFLNVLNPMTTQDVTLLTTSADSVTELSITFDSNILITSQMLSVFIETKYSPRFKNLVNSAVPDNSPYVLSGFPINSYNSLLGRYSYHLDFSVPTYLFDNRVIVTCMASEITSLTSLTHSIVCTKIVSKGMTENEESPGLDVGLISVIDGIISKLTNEQDQINQIDRRIANLEEQMRSCVEAITNLRNVIVSIVGVLNSLVPASKPQGLAFTDVALTALSGLLNVIYPPASFLINIGKDLIDDVVMSSLNGIQFEDIALNFLSAIITIGSHYNITFTFLFNSAKKYYNSRDGEPNMNEELELETLSIPTITYDQALNDWRTGDDQIVSMTNSPRDLSADRYVNYSALPFEEEINPFPLNSRFCIYDYVHLQLINPSSLSYDELLYEYGVYTFVDCIIVINQNGMTVSKGAIEYVSARNNAILQIRYSEKLNKKYVMLRLEEQDVELIDSEYSFVYNLISRSTRKLTPLFDTNYSYSFRCDTSVSSFQDINFRSLNTVVITLSYRPSQSKFIINYIKSGLWQSEMIYSIAPGDMDIQFNLTLDDKNTYVVTGTITNGVTTTQFGRPCPGVDEVVSVQYQNSYTSPDVIPVFKGRKYTYDKKKAMSPTIRGTIVSDKVSYTDSVNLSLTSKSFLRAPVPDEQYLILKYTPILPYNITNSDVSKIIPKFVDFNVSVPGNSNLNASNAHGFCKSRCPISALGLCRVLTRS